MEVVYNGYDNTVDLLLTADGSAVDLSTVTRMVLDVSDSITVDSDVSGDAFDWDTGTTGKVILALGDESIAKGVYSNCRLIVYDPTNDNGIMFGKFTLKVS